MPNLYDPTQVERLIESNDRLGDHVVELRAELKYVKFMTVILAVCVVLTAIAVYSAWATASARQDDRERTLVSACIQFNAQRQEVRKALTDSLAALAPKERTVQQDAQLAVYAAEVGRLLPFRDCTPEGIVEYFENPPVDPATR